MPLHCVATCFEGFYSKKNNTSVKVKTTKWKSDSTDGIPIASVQNEK